MMFVRFERQADNERGQAYKAADKEEPKRIEQMREEKRRES